METWKQVKGYEGLYEVSDMGRVKSMARSFTGKDGVTKPVHERILTPLQNKVTERHPMKRHFVELWKENKRKRASVHRIVAEAFVPNPQGKPQVNHIDGDPLNNRPGNMEWCNNSENVKHAYEHNLRSRVKKPIKGVNQITGEVLIFDNAGEAARYLDVTPGAIRSVLKGYGNRKGNTSGSSCGYTWSYLQSECND